MTTKLVGLKEFRNNLGAYATASVEKNICFIVLKKSTPILEVKPANQKTLLLERLKKETTKAREDIRKGKIYSQEQILKEFGL